MKVLKVPFSGGCLGKNKGTDKAPGEIYNASKSFYLNEKGIQPNLEVEEVDVDNSNIDVSNKNIFEKVKENLAKNEKIVVLGGDHSITFPSFKAFSEKYENPGLIVFDAHADCMQPMESVSHEEYLRALIESNNLKSENVLIVGLRNWHKEEYYFLKERKIKFYTPSEISKEGMHDVCDAVMSVAKNFGALYISIDIDALDPAFAPGTGYLEPGGMSSRDLLYFLERLMLLRNFKMGDIVEVNPEKDINGITVKLASKLLVEMY